MRRPVLLLCLLLLALLTPACSPADPGGELRRAVNQELQNPDSIWARSLRPDTALSDLARFRSAPVYRAALDYDPAKRVLTGSQEILFTNTTGKPVDTLYLFDLARAWGDPQLPEADRFALKNLKVNGKAVSHTQQKFYSAIPLAKPLPADGSVLITFELQARIPYANPPRGGELDFSANPGNYGGNELLADGLSPVIPLIMTDAAPLDNLTKDGVYINPLYALWDVRLTMPARWRPISSGSMVSEADAAEGRRTTRMAAAANSFYLFASSRLLWETREVDGVSLTVYFPEVYEPAGKAILADAARALEALQAQLGPHPFRELEILPVDYGTAVAGENRAGTVMLNSAYFATHSAPRQAPAVTDPWLTTVFSRSTAEQVRDLVAHELAHSWWGHLVWSDVTQGPVWIEGITEASGQAALEAAWGPAAAEARRTWQQFTYRHLRATGYADVAPGKPPADPENVREHQAMSYAKPALFYGEVRRMVGKEVYFTAMRRYLDQNRFAMTADRGPVEALIENPAVAALYQRWMLETRGDEDLGLFTPEQRKELGIR